MTICCYVEALNLKGNTHKLQVHALDCLDLLQLSRSNFNKSLQKQNVFEEEKRVKDSKDQS